MMTTPRRGRPTVAADDRHSMRATVALTAGQLAQIERAAAAAGAPVSVTLRRIVLTWLDENADAPPPDPKPAAPPEAELVQAVSALSAQLAHVGRNLNQIAHSLNRSALRNLLRRRGDDEIAAALRETRAVLEQIPAVLADVMEARR